MTKKSQQDVRQRLISTGLKFFAEKGYEGATVREICDAAHSNLAAINYYFRDKAGYYEEVSTYAQSLRMAELQKLYAAQPDGDPWEVLRIHVDTLLSNAYDSEMFLSAWFCFREFLDTNNKRAQYQYEQAKDSHMAFEKKIRELMAKLLEEAATEQNVALLHYTYVSLSLFLVIESNMVQDIHSTLRILPKISREHLRDHIVGLVKASAEKMKQEFACSKQGGHL